jgi:hypothetical protein
MDLDGTAKVVQMGACDFLICSVRGMSSLRPIGKTESTAHAVVPNAYIAQWKKDEKQIEAIMPKTEISEGSSQRFISLMWKMKASHTEAIRALYQASCGCILSDAIEQELEAIEQAHLALQQERPLEEERSHWEAHVENGRRKELTEGGEGGCGRGGRRGGKRIRMPLFELTEEQKLREAEQQVHQIVQEMVAAVASHAYTAKIHCDTVDALDAAAAAERDKKKRSSTAAEPQPLHCKAHFVSSLVLVVR